jgi:lactoylglutathione lyase
MSGSLRNVGAITLFVEDVQTAKRFYEDVFDVKVVYEDAQSAALDIGNTLVNLLARSEARDLIEPAVVADRDAGSHFQLTVWVDDADAICAELAAIGVPLLNGPLDREWGVRTASFTDPDGNIWEIAQQLS